MPLIIKITVLYAILFLLSLILRKLAKRKLDRPSKCGYTKKYYWNKKYVVLIMIFFDLIMFFLIVGLIISIDKNEILVSIIFAILIMCILITQIKMYLRINKTCLIIEENSVSYFNGIVIKNKIMYNTIKAINLIGSNLVIDIYSSNTRIVIPFYFESKKELIKYLKNKE